ncbi:MAG: hypothetical protein ACJAVD_000318 [Porticoccaceae bacterium]|jgi:hypothetical protein
MVFLFKYLTPQKKQDKHLIENLILNLVQKELLKDQSYYRYLVFILSLNLNI